MITHTATINRIEDRLFHVTCPNCDYYARVNVMPENHVINFVELRSAPADVVHVSESGIDIVQEIIYRFGADESFDRDFWAEELKDLEVDL